MTAILEIDSVKQINSSIKIIVEKGIKYEIPENLNENYKNNNLIYEVTKDPYLLQQYYKIREDLYKADLGLKDFSGKQDHFDIEGDIIVIRQGLKVLGGCRINFSIPGQRRYTPLEEDNFCMLNIYPELHLENKIYCEFSRLVLLPEIRHGSCLKQLVEKAISHSRKRNAKYLFSISPTTQSRIYRHVVSLLNLNFITDKTKQVPYKSMFKELTKIDISYMELTPKVENSSLGLNY